MSGVKVLHGLDWVGLGLVLFLGWEDEENKLQFIGKK